MDTPRLSLVIPAYNEERRLPATLDTLLSSDDVRLLSAEVLVVDDGSADDTAQVIRSFAKRDGRVVPVILPAHRGKGGAVKEGVRRSRGAVVAFTDADLAYGIEALAQVVRGVEEGADVSVGARNLAPGGYRYSLVRRITNTAFSTLVSMLAPVGVLDPQCGLKAFKGDLAREVFARVNIDGYCFDVEVLWRCRRAGAVLKQVPVSMVRDDSSSSKVHVLRDGIVMAKDLLLLRLRTLFEDRRGV